MGDRTSGEGFVFLFLLGLISISLFIDSTFDAPEAFLESACEKVALLALRAYGFDRDQSFSVDTNLDAWGWVSNLAFSRAIVRATFLDCHLLLPLFSFLPLSISSLTARGFSPLAF